MAIFPGTSITPAAGGVYTYPINQSLRFEDGSSAYLSRTPATTGNKKTFTYSGWFKRGNVNSWTSLFGVYVGGTVFFDIGFTSDAERFRVVDYYTNANLYLLTSARLRDPSAWYHIVASIDTTQAVASDRVKLWINGQLQTDFDTETYPSLNYDTNIGITNASYPHLIGKTNIYHADAYMAEVNFIDGQALGPEYFGETDDTWGIWKPKEYTGSYGTNGFYLDFSNGAAIGEDSSGNSNDWTANNLAATDIMLDSPTNNFCTLNPLSLPDGELREGNLNWLSPAASSSVFGTYHVSSGKWYYEMRADNTRSGIGIKETESSGQWYLSSSLTGRYSYYGINGYFYTEASGSAYGATFTAGDIIGVAFDLDSGSIEFYKNGVSQGVATSSLPAGTYTIYCNDGSSTAIFTSKLNFGQDSSFNGSETAQNNTDDNGYGDFYYSPPSGFLALCSANLPEPAVIPSEQFNTILYTGNSSTQSITGVGFQPDWVWAKGRSVIANHNVFDAVRGATKRIFTSSTSAEQTTANTLTSFDSDGFSIGSHADVNTSGGTYVAWNWKADNTSGSSNTDGSITSTVAANPDAGFSIVSYTGADNAGDTVGHGLSQAPEMIIVKRRNLDREWAVYHNGVAADAETDYLVLNSTAVAVDNVAYWNDTAPTSSVFSLSTSPSTNNLGDSYIAYCFHSVPGYSKFGSYTANGSADGPFIYCGFKPAFVMMKRTNSTSDWTMLDFQRNGYNVDNNPLYANLTNSEATTDLADLLSNGFKLRSTSTPVNATGSTYIYMAFAESPFNYSTAR